MRDWNDLQYFLAVQRSGTLATAAKQLGVDATTAGRRLSALERWLRAPVFQRQQGRLRLSEVGSEVLAVVEEIEQRVHAIERRALAVSEQVHGPVRIAATEAMAIRHLLPNLQLLQRRQPKLQLEVVTGNVALSLADGQADVAIRLLRPTQPGLVGRKAGEIGIAVYAASAYLKGRPPARVSDGFQGHRVVGYVAEAREWPEARWLAENASAATVSTRLNSVLGVAAAAREGAGLAVLPCGIGDGDSALKRVTPVVMSRDIWLVYHRDLQRTPRVRAALALLTEVLAKEAAVLRGRP